MDLQSMAYHCNGILLVDKNSGIAKDRGIIDKLEATYSILWSILPNIHGTDYHGICMVLLRIS